MKKAGSLLLAVLLLTLTWLPTAATAASSKLPLRVEYQGNRIYFPDAQPFVDKAQRVQVPVRFVSEALGAEVKWAGPTKTVTINQDSNVITLVLGKKPYDINGQTKQMDASAQRVGGRTFVPLRFVSEGLGAYVKWDSAVRTVYISKTPFEPADEKKQEPAKSEKVVEENMHGFKVKINTGSGLQIEKGSGEKDYALINFLIYLPEHGDGIDYEKQVKEVEDVLSQQVDQDTVKKVMEYVKKKTHWKQELEQKTFTDSKYKIYVGSRNTDPVDVTIFNKKK